MGDVRYVVGLPERARRPAAELYDEAFRAKLRAAVPDDAARIDVLASGMDLAKAVGAFDVGELIGVAGLSDRSGSFMSGIGFGLLRRRLGLRRAVRAYAVLALLDTTPAAGDVVVDGIAVSEASRGRGVGTGLLATLEAHALDRGERRIRLEVVDTNPAARRLYERLGFVEIKHERTPYLRRSMGFGAATTMVKPLEG